MDSKRFTKLIYIIVPAAIGIFLLYYYFGLSVKFTESRPVLEKGQRYASRDYIAQASGEVKAEKRYLDTEEVGIHEISFEVSKGMLSRDVVLHYEVVDTTPPQINILSRSISIDPGTKYTDEDVLKNVEVDEGEITFETDLDTSSSGTYQIEIKAIDEYDNESSDSYEVIVNDLDPPVVFNDGEGTVIRRGSGFNINDHISYGDNTDPEPKLTVRGAVNSYRVGRYPLHVTLTDASGNAVSWSFTVQVVNRIDHDDDYDDYYYPFEEFINDYKGEGRKFGIDVSEWQGDIDFEKLKEAGCEFVMMRIGFAHNGFLTFDKSFRDNIMKAKETGMPVGIYYYSHDKTPENVRSTLEQIFAELGDTELELPIVFDWENFSDFQNYDVSFQMLNHLYDVFEQTVREHGYEPMLYGSKYYLETVWNHRDRRPVWLAHYTDWSSYKDPYFMWQVCAWGRIDGIDGDVDFDIMFTDE